MADTPIDPARPSGEPEKTQQDRTNEAAQEGPAGADPAAGAIPPGTPVTADMVRQMILEAFKDAPPLDPSKFGGAFPTLLGGPSPLGAGDGGGGHKLMTAPTNPNRPDTPNNDFIHGVKGKLKYNSTPGTGTATWTTFDIEQITLDDEVDTDDITNTSSGGGQIVLDGIQKITGQITFVYDSLNCFLVAPLPWKSRTYVEIQVMPDGVTIGAMFTVLINGYSYGTGPKAGTVRVQCKYMSSGPITYPTASQTSPTPALTS